MNLEEERTGINARLNETEVLLTLECLELRQLCRSRRVCRLWNRLITERILAPRRTISIRRMASSQDFKDTTDQSEWYELKIYAALPAIPDFHQAADTLKLSNFVLQDTWFAHIPFKQLQHLHLKECYFPQITLNIGNHLDRLSCLKSLVLINTDVDDSDMVAIACGLPRLETLVVSRNNLITGSHMTWLCRQLKSLKLAKCLSLSYNKVISALSSFHERNIQLEHLDLKSNKFCIKRCSLVNFVLGHFPKLKVLKYKLDGGVMPTTETYLAVDLEKLVLVERKVSGFKLISHEFFSWLFAQPLPKLRHLSFLSRKTSPLTNEGFGLCLSRCPDLETLKLEGLAALTEEGLTCISRLRNLVRLRLANIPLNDNIVSTIVERCDRLREVVIEYKDDTVAKPFNITPVLIRRLINHFERDVHRATLDVKIFRSLLPRRKRYHLPHNLRLEIEGARDIIGPEGLYIPGRHRMLVDQPADLEDNGPI